MEIKISRQESLQLLEEMQEDKNKLCPNCNGIILWRRGKINRKNKTKGEKYTCNECKKTFILNPINPKIKGEVAEFLIQNIKIISPQDLSDLIKKYFKTTISRQTIWLFKRFLLQGATSK